MATHKPFQTTYLKNSVMTFNSQRERECVCACGWVGVGVDVCLCVCAFINFLLKVTRVHKSHDHKLPWYLLFYNINYDVQYLIYFIISRHVFIIQFCLFHFKNTLLLSNIIWSCEKKGEGGKKTFEKESIKRQAHNFQFFFPTTHLFCSLWVYTALSNYTFLSYGEKRRVKKNERKIIKNARYITSSFPYHIFVLFTPSRPGGPLIYFLILQRKKKSGIGLKIIARSIKTTAHNVQFFQHF